jgi:MarR family transcriptional regulator for hemolysin
MFTLGQLNRQWRKLVDRRLRPHGLTEATWLPLMRLARVAEPMRQKDLAAALGLDGSSVVRLLDGLEASGLITRAGHADRRAKAIELTPQGHAVVQELHDLLHDSRAALFDSVPQAELDAAFSVLERLARRLAVLDAEDGA